MEFPIILHYVCKRSLKRKINERINCCQSDSLDWHIYLWSLSTIKEVPLKFRIYGGILMETARSKITSPGTFEVILRTFSIIWVPTDDTIINFVGLYNTISFQKKLWSKLCLEYIRIGTSLHWEKVQYFQNLQRLQELNKGWNKTILSISENSRP